MVRDHFRFRNAIQSVVTNGAKPCLYEFFHEARMEARPEIQSLLRSGTQEPVCSKALWIVSVSKPLCQKEQRLSKERNDQACGLNHVWGGNC